MSAAGPTDAGAAFGDVGLALGALALGGDAAAGPGAEAAGGRPGREVFLLPRAAPEDLWRPFAAAVRPTRDGHGLVLEVDLAQLTRRAPDDAAAAALRAAAAARRAPRPRVRVMGVVNVTPDSFSDGGRHLDPARAVAHGLALARAGADLLDVGGESTRPGAAPVPPDEELRRVLPVVEALARDAGVPVSVDTSKALVARAAVVSGARMVNDVSAGEADPGMLACVAELAVDFVAMHRQGTPDVMQRDPRYGDPVLDVANHLRRRVRACLDSGLPLSRITLDPGIGFGKRLPHNLALLARTAELRSLGLPLLVGPSRKSFIAHALEADEERWGPPAGAEPRGRAPARPGAPPDGRLGGTAAAVTVAVLGGASIVRVHDVAAMVEATRVAEALAAAAEAAPGA